MMGKGIATDTSWLLMILPSPSSTDQPTSSNHEEYGTLEHTVGRNSSSASFEMLLPTGKELEREYDEGFLAWLAFTSRRAFQGRPVKTVALLIIATLLAFLFGSSSMFSGYSREPKQLPLKGGERAPFSTLDPVADMGLYALERPKETSPPDSVLPESRHRALPTNSWYQNMLMAKGAPTSVHRVYAMPYVLDVVGPIPGLRAHANHIDASTTVVQLSFVDSYGITVGAAPNGRVHSDQMKASSKKYSVVSATALAVTLQWEALPMSASIVKGMPYTTMHYPKPLRSGMLLPTVASELKLATAPVADGNSTIRCGNKVIRVESELKLSFEESDFTWLLFFSEPVMLQCIEQPTGLDGAAVLFQIVELVEPVEDEALEPLTIRAALLSNCTSGQNHMYCIHKESPSQTAKYASLLREHANFYPGPMADVRYDIEYEKDEAILKFDWDVRNMKAPSSEHATDKLIQDNLRHDPSSHDIDVPFDLIMYALPHHLDRMSTDFMPWGSDRFCTSLLIGTGCIVSGSLWELVEDLPPIAFQAPRPPSQEAVFAISKALKNDISFRLHEYFERGAGDTYFSGKMLARLARVLLIAEELKVLCNARNRKDLGYVLTSQEKEDYVAACQNVSLPSDDDIGLAVSRLRKSVEVWINGKADIPFVYDPAWGGVISCGCLFDSHIMSCSNQFPDCPSISDPGLDFGNGTFCRESMITHLRSACCNNCSYRFCPCLG